MSSVLRSFFLASFVLLSQGCGAYPYLKGVDGQGSKVYLGPVPLENTEAYQEYLNSRHSEVDKQNYIFRRLKTPEAQQLSYYHDGIWYTWVEAYRGGIWLVRNRYKKGQDARTFIREYVWHSEDTGQLHLVKYPDGSIQEGYYILLNELDLLEETLKKNSKAGPAA